MGGTCKAGRYTEREFQAQVIQLAGHCGWTLIHHSRPARTSSGRWLTPITGTPGFPDIVLCRRARPGRPARLAFCELKVGRNKPSALQLEWLDGLREAGQDAYLWTPTDWPEIEIVLRG
jgi:hypothetical protein